MKAQIPLLFTLLFFVPVAGASITSVELEMWLNNDGSKWSGIEGDAVNSKIVITTNLCEDVTYAMTLQSFGEGGTLRNDLTRAPTSGHYTGQACPGSPLSVNGWSVSAGKAWGYEQVLYYSFASSGGPFSKRKDVTLVPRATPTPAPVAVSMVCIPNSLVAEGALAKKCYTDGSGYYIFYDCGNMVAATWPDGRVTCSLPGGAAATPAPIAQTGGAPRQPGFEVVFAVAGLLLVSCLVSRAGRRHG